MRCRSASNPRAEQQPMLPYLPSAACPLLTWHRLASPPISLAISCLDHLLQGGENDLLSSLDNLAVSPIAFVHLLILAPEHFLPILPVQSPFFLFPVWPALSSPAEDRALRRTGYFDQSHSPILRRLFLHQVSQYFLEIRTRRRQSLVSREEVQLHVPQTRTSYSPLLHSFRMLSTAMDQSIQSTPDVDRIVQSRPCNTMIQLLLKPR